MSKTKKEPTANPFPGQFTERESPRHTVEVTGVRSGTALIRSVKGPYLSARMDCMTFMQKFERIDS